MATSMRFLAFYYRRDGYGYAAQCILRALQARTACEQVEMEPGTAALDWRYEGPAVGLCLPDWWEFVHARPFVGFTMHEATVVPPGWTEAINSSGVPVMLVPCEWNREVYEAAGVRVPVRVARFGVDPEHYWPLERHRADNAPYTFVWSGNGAADMRKGWDIAYQAFVRAFGKRRDVRLVFHFRQPIGGNARFADPNVETVTGYLDLPMWRGLLEAADVFVFPSRGEGWGLPPREAAATGLPVLATNWGGLAEEIEEWALPIEVGMLSTARYGFYPAASVGEWAEPDIDHVVELMRWCEANREAAAERGRAAAAFIGGTTWDRTARAILQTVEEVGNGI